MDNFPLVRNPELRFLPQADISDSRKAFASGSHELVAVPGVDSPPTATDLRLPE
jgi:hypothetical protein